MEEPDKSSDRLTSRVAFWFAVGGTVIIVVLYLYGFFVYPQRQPFRSSLLYSFDQPKGRLGSRDLGSNSRVLPVK
jgi:hypothetical protein